MADLSSRVIQFENDVQKLHQLVNGSVDETISVESGTLPSMSGLQKILSDALGSAAVLLEAWQAANQSEASAVDAKSARDECVSIASQQIRWNPKTLVTSVTIPSGNNAYLQGPVSIADGVNIEISDGATLTVN